MTVVSLTLAVLARVVHVTGVGVPDNIHCTQTCLVMGVSDIHCTQKCLVMGVSDIHCTQKCLVMRVSDNIHCTQKCLVI